MYFSLSFLNRIYTIGFLLTVILAFVDLLTFFYYPHAVLGDIFLATQEQTPLTWISSLAIFSIALSCFSVYFKTKKKLWYFLSIIFFFFSVDDAIYFHERFSGFIQDSTSLFHFFPSYIWIILYFPLVVFSLSALVFLLWESAAMSTKKLIVMAIMLLGFAVFLDLVDGVIQKNENIVFCFNTSCNIALTHVMRLVEELSEVIALGILGYVNIREHCIFSEKK